MPKLFGVTLFVSATLLFLVQPMVGKMILPLLGGTPAVWNTCMVFFQALLLAGYYYAHKTTTNAADPPAGRRPHAVLLVAAGGAGGRAALVANHSPVAGRQEPGPAGQQRTRSSASSPCWPSPSALPFFVVSTTAPLFQKWFAETGHPSAKDPYFLYAASNVGSLLALLAYPFVVEPNLRLVEQAWVWAVGFVVLVGADPAVRERRSRTPRRCGPAPKPKRPGRGAADAGPALGAKLRWLLLAARPVEPDAGGDDRRDHGHRVDAAAVGRPAGPVPAHVHHRLLEDVPGLGPPVRQRS